MHGGLSPALRPRQAGAPNVRGPSRPRREPTAITKDESRLQQKLLKNKIVPLLFKHTYALKPEKKSNQITHYTGTLEGEPTIRDPKDSAHKSSWSSENAHTSTSRVAHSSYS